MSNNKSSICPLSPRRKMNTQELSLGRFEDVPPPTFGHESFMSPLPTKCSSKTTPPNLCRERKRSRVQHNAFQSDDGKIMPEFLIPSLGLDIFEEEINAPIKLRLRQRLTLPPTLDTEGEAENNRIDLPFRRSLSFLNQRGRTQFPNSNRSVSSSSDKSSDSLLIGIDVDSVSRPGKLRRRSSRNALTA